MHSWTPSPDEAPVTTATFPWSRPSELESRLGQDRLAGDQDSQFTADAHPSGRERIGRIELAAGHGERVVVVHHDGHVGRHLTVRVTFDPDPVGIHAEDGAHAPVGCVIDHLGDGEGAVSDREGSGAGLGDGGGKVEAAECGIKRVHPLG
jgi:hypothetical protein